MVDEFLPKIEEWVEQSTGKIRADFAHDKLVAISFTGSERSTRRAVAQVKKTVPARARQIRRPWVTEPGLWLHYDFGDGPVIDGPDGPFHGHHGRKPWPSAGCFVATYGQIFMAADMRKRSPSQGLVFFEKWSTSWTRSLTPAG